MRMKLSASTLLERGGGVLFLVESLSESIIDTMQDTDHPLDHRTLTSCMKWYTAFCALSSCKAGLYTLNFEIQEISGFALAQAK